MVDRQRLSATRSVDFWVRKRFLPCIRPSSRVARAGPARPRVLAADHRAGSLHSGASTRAGRSPRRAARRSSFIAADRVRSPGRGRPPHRYDVRDRAAVVLGPAHGVSRRHPRRLAWRRRLPYALAPLRRNRAIHAEYPDPLDGFRRLYFKTVLLDPRALRFLCGGAGADKVVLGSDYPLSLIHI